MHSRPLSLQLMMVKVKRFRLDLSTTQLSYLLCSRFLVERLSKSARDVCHYRRSQTKHDTRDNVISLCVHSQRKRQALKDEQDTSAVDFEPISDDQERGIEQSWAIYTSSK